MKEKIAVLYAAPYLEVQSSITSFFSWLLLIGRLQNLSDFVSGKVVTNHFAPV